MEKSFITLGTGFLGPKMAIVWIDLSRRWSTF